MCVCVWKGLWGTLVELLEHLFQVTPKKPLVFLQSDYLKKQFDMIAVKKKQKNSFTCTSSDDGS